MSRAPSISAKERKSRVLFQQVAHRYYLARAEIYQPLAHAVALRAALRAPAVPRPQKAVMSFEGAFLDLRICVQVDLCRFDLFVTQPERDHRGGISDLQCRYGRRFRKRSRLNAWQEG